MAEPAKVVLVTGGSSGLGAAICARLARRGHRVYGAARRVVDGDRSDGVALLRMDVTDEASVRRGVAEILNRESRIDVLVNNAGVSMSGAIEDVTPELAMRLLDTNLLGAHRVCRAVLPGMRERRRGLVIQISSVAASFGLPFRAFYCASKAALERYGEALALEMERFGVKVVNVQPGDFKTEIGASRLQASALTPDHRPGYERAMQIVEEGMQRGRDPDELARVIERVIDSSRPKATYVVARGVQRMSVIGKKLLPGRLFQRIVGRHFE